MHAGKVIIIYYSDVDFLPTKDNFGEKGALYFGETMTNFKSWGQGWGGGCCERGAHSTNKGMRIQQTVTEATQKWFYLNKVNIEYCTRCSTFRQLLSTSDVSNDCYILLQTVRYCGEVEWFHQPTTFSFRFKINFSPELSQP